MKRIFLMSAFTGLMLTFATVQVSGVTPDPRYHYVVLANPTAYNLEIIRFLVESKIFRINPGKTRFIGVYHKNQVYDFEKSREYIRTKAPGLFTLREITGTISEADIFRNNGCSAEFRDIFTHSSGIIFFGGPDIQPGIYNEENTHSVVTDPARHTFETSLLFHLLGSTANPGFTAWLQEKPLYVVTGFCLGLQTMNVATGGTLVQDIPFQVYGKNTPQETLTVGRNDLHRNYWKEVSDDNRLMGVNLHPLCFTGHPFFGKTIRISKNAHPLIYSSHHQSIENIGMGFEVTALSPDGKVIEGMVHRQFPHVFGVQFHPEVPALYEDRELWKFAPDDDPMTFHRIIGKKSVGFHKRYWKYISDAIHQSEKQ